MGSWAAYGAIGVAQQQTGIGIRQLFAVAFGVFNLNRQALRVVGVLRAMAQWVKSYKISLQVRKRIEECFGWAKTVGGFRKTRFIGTAKVQAQALMTFAAWNLTRMMALCGWREGAT